MNQSVEMAKKELGGRRRNGWFGGEGFDETLPGVRFGIGGVYGRGGVTRMQVSVKRHRCH